MGIFVRPGLGLIRIGIQKALGYRITSYKMFVNVLQNKVEFDVPDKTGKIMRYPYDDSQSLVNVVKNMAKNQLTTNESLDIIVVEYNDKSQKITLYYTDENKVKQSKLIPT